MSRSSKRCQRCAIEATCTLPESDDSQFPPACNVTFRLKSWEKQDEKKKRTKKERED